MVRRTRLEDALLGLKELIAMGVGGMVGGGIFSVLGLSIGLAGHAAPLAFVMGGFLALVTGWSYARLGVHFRSDGGTFTYLEHAFAHPNIAGLGGWLLITGYVGTLALYAYTFGAYGAAMLGGDGHGHVLQHFLETAVVLVFLGINLYGIRAAGHTEDVIVLVKVVILGVFAVIALAQADFSALKPFFDHGGLGLLMGAALIFVAYEGFELIPNAVNESRDPQRDLPRAIVISVLITMAIYVLVSLVAVTALKPEQIREYREYALAIAAEPFLGQAGFVLIGLGAVLSTASAINATMFGTARLASIMAREQALPGAFGHRSRNSPIPWASLIALAATTLVFVNLADLTVISSFASATFLLIFACVNLAAYRLRRHIGIHPAAPLLGMAGCLFAWGRWSFIWPGTKRRACAGWGWRTLRSPWPNWLSARGAWCRGCPAARNDDFGSESLACAEEKRDLAQAEGYREHGEFWCKSDHARPIARSSMPQRKREGHGPISQIYSSS